MTIDKNMFEAALSFAQYPDESIYNSIRPYLDEEEVNIRLSVLGPSVSAIINSDNNTELVSNLKIAVSNLICLTAMCKHLRGMDLVLTQNGFGIVSNSNVAPASQQRVDALWQECLTNHDIATDNLLDILITIEEWGSTFQAMNMIPTLFEMRRFIHQYAGLSDGQGSHDAWLAARRTAFEADIRARNVISSAQMEALLTMERYHTTEKPIEEHSAWIIELFRRFVGSMIAGKAQNDILDNIVDYMENNINYFPAYSVSSQYTANHYENFQNTEESSVYIF